MNFTSGGTIAGTISSTPPAPAPPPKPPGIPEHYIFDEEVELWMPPSAIAKAAAHALVPLLSGPSSGITVIKSGDSNPTPYTGSSNDPICFEFTNTGVCSRLNGGQICRYRHLQANHPDVIADKVRQGKLPPSVLEPGLAPTEPGIPPDPGHGAQLCFDFINSGTCGRLSSGAGCKYRHLAPNHPDVIADKVRQGKLNPAMAAQLLSGVAGGGAGGLAPLGGPGAGLQAAALQPVGLGGASGWEDPSTAMALAASMPDPGPGVQLCFDFVNKGTCSRIARGDICRYRHLAPNHPDVIADKVRQGKAPGAMPTPPMGNFTEHLAMQGAAAQLAANLAAQADAPRGFGGGGDDSGERFRQRDRLRRERSDGYGRGADVDRHGYERHDRHDPDRDRRERERDHERREYERRDYERRDRGRERDDYYERRDRDRGRYDDRRYDERRDERRGGGRYDDRRYGDSRRDDERDGRRGRDDDARRDGGGASALPGDPPRGGDPGGEA